MQDSVPCGQHEEDRRFDRETKDYEFSNNPFPQCMLSHFPARRGRPSQITEKPRTSLARIRSRSTAVRRVVEVRKVSAREPAQELRPLISSGGVV
jgi:hypothetical protein